MVGKRFIFDNVRLAYDRQHVRFDYKLETDKKTYSFTETLIFPKSLPGGGTVDRILRALHLAIGISYYKTYIPLEIDHDYSINDEESLFWNIVYKNGLGEFLYKNKLSPKNIAKFAKQTGNLNPDDNDTIHWNENLALLGIGGGKDSIVAGELLLESNVKTAGFVLATNENAGMSTEVAEKMGVSLNVIKREIDHQLLDKDALPGAYKGHIPISLIFALVGCLVATKEGQGNIIVANESSASIPQTHSSGMNVNHQWSKSFEFEKLFQSFLHDNISTNINYSSVVRPLSSIAIAKIFANYPIYFESFSSDNSLLKVKQENREHPRWSQNSPKSLSSYILLAPWISDNDLMIIFGKNFLDDSSLETMFLGLLGISGKPILDCVGTPDELRLSLSLLYEHNRHRDTHLMKLAESKGEIIDNTKGPLKDALTINQDHVMPEILINSILPLMKRRLK